MTTTANRASTFLRSIDGSSGTIVLGHGIPAYHVEITNVDDGFAFCFNDKGETIVVPESSIVYYRFDPS